MRNEDYGRIARILADGTPVELQFTIVNTIYPDGRTAYNTISEIAGSDKKDEVVMLGGPPRLVAFRHRRHRQRHRLRGDDGGGTHSQGHRRAAAPHHPRRTLERRGARPARLARLRQGTLRNVRSAKPEYAKLVAYLNIDSGTGRPEARAFLDRRRRPRSSGSCSAVRGFGRSARRPRAAAIRPALIRRHSTTWAAGIGFVPGPDRIQQPPGTPPRYLASGLSSRTRSNGDTMRRCSITSRCATRCCRDSPRAEMPPLPQGRGN